MKIPTKAQHGNASLIPTTPPPNQTCPKRRVQIGSRPIGGRATTWTVGVFLEFLKRVGNIYVRSKEEAPDPHFHWCVIVGEYYHQAQIDLDGRMLYDNGSVSWKDGWLLYDVGTTTFNDAAIVDAATSLRAELPDKYDMWDNNCHHFTVKLIDKICPPGHKEMTKATRFHRRSTSLQFDEDRALPKRNL